MLTFLESFIDEKYKNSHCYFCRRPISSDNSSLRSIFKGMQRYNRPLCNEHADKAIGTEIAPVTKFTVRKYARINRSKQTEEPVRPFRKRRFMV